MGRSRPEFPLLAVAELYPVRTQGNGNCLFHALSDQIFGDQSHHEEIRAHVIQHMRTNPDNFKPFVTVGGSTTRRNPKRKNAGAYASSAVTHEPTEAEIDAAYEEYLEVMARGGTYGDHLEVNAASNAYGYSIKIWHPEDQPWLSTPFEDTHPGQVLHVALAHEHYSSVRNADGPHSGPPAVKDPEVYDLSKLARAGKKTSTSKALDIEPWKIQLVIKSLAYPIEATSVNKALMKFEGDVDEAVDYLMMHENSFSTGSSSIERDQDSEDEEEYSTGSRKKQDRRQSRATKQKATISAKKLSQRLVTEKASQVEAKKEAEKDTKPEIKAETSPGSSRSSSRRARYRRVIEDTDTEDDSSETSAGSTNSTAPPSIAPSASPAPSTITTKSSQTKTLVKEPHRGVARPIKADNKKTSMITDASGPTKAAAPKLKSGQKKPSASQQKNMKKRAQKAAAKERKQGQGSQSSVANPAFKGKRPSPPVAGIGSLLI